MFYVTDLSDFVHLKGVIVLSTLKVSTSVILASGLGADLSDLIHLKGVMVGLVGRDHGGVSSQGVVDPRVGDQVRLELVQVHIQGTLKSGRNIVRNPTLSYVR